MSALWRHLTHPEGMTVSLLAKAAGMDKHQVRAELVALEAAGKIIRERAPIGKEHLWWRSGCRPLSDLDAVLAMGLAARFHKTPSALRAVMQRISTRAENPAIRQIIRLSATSHDPHAIAWDAVHRCG